MNADGSSQTLLRYLQKLKTAVQIGNRSGHDHRLGRDGPTDLHFAAYDWVAPNFALILAAFLALSRAIRDAGQDQAEPFAANLEMAANPACHRINQSRRETKPQG